MECTLKYGAYSLNGGVDFTKYANSLLIPNPGIVDFGDPKVWNTNTAGGWVMVVMLAVSDRVHFHGSNHLKTWEFLSDFGPNFGGQGVVWESPGLRRKDGNQAH